jgi:hypothetical protein
MEEKGEVKETVIRQKRFIVKPFKRVELHDWNYGEEKSMSENCKKVCAFYTLPVRNYEAEVQLSEIHSEFVYNGDTIPCDFYEVQFCSYKKDNDLAGMFVEARRENRCFPAYVKEQKELGCDSASFNIRIDDKETTIVTAEDGMYGNATIYKDKNAYCFGFQIDTGMKYWEEMIALIRALFQVKSEIDIM